jgi:hypothetical protein
MSSTTDMQGPTDDERATLERRRAEFPRLLAQLRPGIEELAAFLGASNVDDLEQVVHVADAFLADAELAEADEDQRIWLHTRLMYLAGEALVDRHGGHWFLEIDPGSPQYLRYVVRVGGGDGPIVDPAELAHRVLLEPRGSRSLGRALDTVGEAT